MKSLTKLGIFLRKLRIENLLNQADLAVKLGISVAFYSAVENGRKPMPTELRTKLITYYNMDELQIGEMDKAIALSRDEIKINIEELDESTRELVACFARNFNTLEESDKVLITKLLKK